MSNLVEVQRPTSQSEPALDERIWNDWVAKGREIERKSTAAFHVVVAAVVGLLAVGMYFILTGSRS